MINVRLLGKGRVKAGLLINIMLEGRVENERCDQCEVVGKRPGQVGLLINIMLEAG